MFTTPFFLFNLIYICWPLCWVHLFNFSLLQILYLIGQSHGSSSKPLDIQTWPGRPGEVHPEPQNEEESDFESSTLVRPSLGFTEDGVKKRQSAEIMSDSSLGKNASAAEDHTRRNNYQLRTETEATVHTGSLKLDDRKLEKCCLFRWVSISAAKFSWSPNLTNVEKEIHLASYQWVMVVV